MKRLTPAFVTFLMLIAFAALVGAYIVKTLGAKEEPATIVETRLIPMPIADLEPGTLINEAHLGQAPVPSDALTPDTLISERVILGRVVKEKLNSAQPIRSDQLYQPGERPPIEVANDRRAVTVTMGARSVADGLIRAGQYVDVHLTPDPSRDPRLQGGTTMTLVKGVKVLAIHRPESASSRGREDFAVTLELSPEQANTVILAGTAGELTVSYNPAGEGNDSVKIGDSDRATLEEILNLKPLPEPARPFETEQYRAGSRTVSTFREDRRIP